MYLSKNGTAVRVHRDGSTSVVHVLDPAYRAERNAACHVACSSPAARWHDVVVPRVPPGIAFEAKFHGGTLLRVEELSRAPSAPARNASVSSAPRVPTQDVRIRIRLPPRPVGVTRVDSIYAAGPCKNMVVGAGFPVILVPDENTARQIRTRFLRLRPSASRRSDTEALLTKRYFMQHAGYALHAALKGDQGVAAGLCTSKWNPLDP